MENNTLLDTNVKEELKILETLYLRLLNNKVKTNKPSYLIKTDNK